MAARKARPASSSISPELEAIRDEEREREAGITRRMAQRPTISPALDAAREATIKREKELAGRSVRKPPVTR